MDERKREHPFDFARSAAIGRGGRGSYDQRMDRILSAAADVIARSGFDKASMRQIAGASGVSLAGLYHYFDNKDHLLFLIQFRAFSSLLMEVQSHLSGETDPAEQLRVLVRTHISHVARSMATLKVCSHELDSLSGETYDRIWRIRREYYELARSVVVRLIETLAPGSGLDPRVATMSLFGTLNWLYRWYDPERDRSPSSLANQITTQFMAGLSGAGRPGRNGATGTGPRPMRPNANGVNGPRPARKKDVTRASPRTRVVRAH